MLIDNKYKLDQYLFNAFAFAIPFFPLAKILVFIFTILFITERIIYFSSAKQNFIINSGQYIYLPIVLMLFFIMHLFGMLYTNDIEEGWIDIESKIALFVFPLLFLFHKNVSQEYLFKILIAFIIGCFVICTYLLVIAVNEFIPSKNPYYLFYGSLSKFHHPSYLAMYACWCIIILIYFLFNTIGSKFFLLLIFLITFFSGYIILLESKTGIAILAIIILASITIGFIMKKYQVTIAGLLFVLLGFSCYMLYVPEKNNRIILAIKDYSTRNDKKDNDTFIRFNIWQNTIPMLTNSWLMGKGTGDVEETLELGYKQANSTQLQSAIKHNLNAHNQYLQTLIAIGIIGELLLLASLFIPLYLSITERNYLYISFIFLIGVNLLTESMLERQAGIVFYAFFNILLFKIEMQKIKSQYSNYK